MRAAKPFHCLVLSGVPGFRCRAPSYIAATNDNSTAHSQQVSHRRGISRTVSKKEKGISPSHPRDSRPLRYQGAYQPPASRTNSQSFAQGLRKKQQNNAKLPVRPSLSPLRSHAPATLHEECNIQIFLLNFSFLKIKKLKNLKSCRNIILVLTPLHSTNFPRPTECMRGV